MYLFETCHRHCNQKEKKKAPSVVCCSDLSEPPRLNAGKEAKSSSPGVCFGKRVILEGQEQGRSSRESERL